MSTVIDGEYEVTVHEPYDGREGMTEVDDAIALTPEEFAAKSAKDRDVILFTLLRESVGLARELQDKVDEYERKAIELATPEGMQQLTQKFMGGLGGGMLGGLF